jgi:biofilm protein TabA
MILSALEDVHQQGIFPVNINQAIHFLHSSNLASLPDGRLVIDGDQVYAIVSTYTTRPLGKTIELEGHRKFVDIQFLLAGKEIIAWASSGTVPVTVDYDESKDLWKGIRPVEQLTLLHLSTGQTAILYPSDAHAPQIADGEPATVKKIVIKVAIKENARLK